VQNKEEGKRIRVNSKSDIKEKGIRKKMQAFDADARDKNICVV
jgi:hypothetical protein